MMKAHIYVTLKRGVLDPQGDAIHQALKALGFHILKDVRCGKYFELTLQELDLKEASQKMKEMCDQLLANTVIEDYRFEIVS